MAVGNSIQGVAVRSVSLAVGNVFVGRDACLPEDGKH